MHGLDVIDHGGDGDAVARLDGDIAPRAVSSEPRRVKPPSATMVMSPPLARRRRRCGSRNGWRVMLRRLTAGDDVVGDALGLEADIAAGHQGDAVIAQKVPPRIDQITLCEDREIAGNDIAPPAWAA